MMDTYCATKRSEEMGTLETIKKNWLLYRKLDKSDIDWLISEVESESGWANTYFKKWQDAEKEIERLEEENSILRYESGNM